MKRVLSILGLASLLIFSVQPVWANSCPKLIKEAKELLAKAKLVKAVVEQRFEPLGSNETVPFDTRLITATIRKSLQAMIVGAKLCAPILISRPPSGVKRAWACS